MALSESPALVGLLFYGQIKVVQGEKCHLGSVPVGLVFHSSYTASHRAVMRNMVGEEV